MSLYEVTNLFKKHITLDYNNTKPNNAFARGIPAPTKKDFKEQCGSCQVCESACPTKCIKATRDNLEFDYGACIHCGLCVDMCPKDVLKDTGFNYVFSTHRKELVVTYPMADKEEVFTEKPSVIAFRELTKKRGFSYREVAAAGNNSVECELNASFNNVFDSESEGVRAVASPKHADAVLYSGPVSENMADPLQRAWDTMPEPKVLIACGTEAISGGMYQLGKLPKEPDLFIGGDPPRPDVSIQAFRYLMGRFQFSFRTALRKFLESL